MMESNNIMLVERLGKAGILERVPAEILAAGKDIFGEVAKLVERNLSEHKRREAIPVIGDDFMPDTRLYNALGALYPQLSREQKDLALGICLNQFDVVNSHYVQINHTPYIREPLLLADIEIARYVYWPGMGREENITKLTHNFANFEREYMAEGLFKVDKVQNDFLMAYAALRKDMSSFSEDFVKACRPSFLEGVVSGIVGMRFARAKDDPEIQQGKSRLTELMPSSVYGLMEKKYHQKGWADPAKFP